MDRAFYPSSANAVGDSFAAVPGTTPEIGGDERFVPDSARR
jgi:hypothetical protein